MLQLASALAVMLAPSAVYVARLEWFGRPCRRAHRPCLLPCLLCSWRLLHTNQPELPGAREHGWPPLVLVAEPGGVPLQLRMHRAPRGSCAVLVQPPEAESGAREEEIVQGGPLNQVCTRGHLEGEVKLDVDGVDAPNEFGRLQGGEMMERIPFTAFAIDLEHAYAPTDVAKPAHDAIQAEQRAGEVAVSAPAEAA